MKNYQDPYLLSMPETALMIGTTLKLGPSLVPLEILSVTEVQRDTTPERAERILFAYRIPYLPDLTTSLHLAGQTEGERLNEILDQQVRLVANLAKWRGMAFSLRYMLRPERGEVEVALLGRAAARSGQGHYMGREVASDVAALLRSLDYPADPVGSEIELRDLLAPTLNPFVVEIRQHEEVVSMIFGDAYVVYPFRPPLTTWISTFRMLVAQQEPCVISVYLEPTELYSFEREQFARATQLAETLADYTIEKLTRTERLVDPMARVVARMYTDYLQRLSATTAFLLTVQVGSPDPMTARNVAQALASELSEAHTFVEAAQGGASLPSGFDLVVPQNRSDLQAAWQTLTTLDLHPWGRSEATEGKERLRYLVDARTASAAFRFPVPVRGGVPGVRTRQSVPIYDVGPRADQVADGDLLIGTFEDRGGVATLPLTHLNRHALVAGTTGSGKTTTCMHLLAQLWEQSIPFLVIEPAKTEYRALLESPIGKDLLVFTLGDESTSPFRLNPLEMLPGVRVEAHISHLRACFEAALPTFGILPSLIEESLHNVYFDRGWNLTDRGSANDKRLMPTLGEMYFEIIRVTEERGYSEKTLQDIRAAAAGRIGSLLRGSKGRMLNTRRSIPMESLMTRPAVLELESLNDEEKALVMLFLLTMIREYCRATRTESKLQHATIVEEAHRVMAVTPHAADREVSADTRARAVEMFSASLSEIRAVGEGLIIAEQIPSRLAEDALKNTNAKIVHRLPGQDDRQTIGATMNLDEKQERHLANLAPGQAALFTEGYEKPTFIIVPNYRDQHRLPERVPEGRVEAHMVAFYEKHKSLLLPFGGCRYCLQQCGYRDRVAPVAYELKAGQRFRQALRAFEKQRSRGDAAAGWAELVKACQETVGPIGFGMDKHAAYCCFVHLWGYEFTEAMVERFRRALEA